LHKSTLFSGERHKVNTLYGPGKLPSGVAGFAVSNSKMRRYEPLRSDFAGNTSGRRDPRPAHPSKPEDDLARGRAVGPYACQQLGEAIPMKVRGADSAVASAIATCCEMSRGQPRPPSWGLVTEIFRLFVMRTSVGSMPGQWSLDPILHARELRTLSCNYSRRGRGCTRWNSGDRPSA
jgi:hypothetical protein